MAAKEYCAGFVLAVVWSGLGWPLWTAALAGVRAMRESAFGLLMRRKMSPARFEGARPWTTHPIDNVPTQANHEQGNELRSDRTAIWPELTNGPFL
jgi:hypothetical protein